MKIFKQVLMLLAIIGSCLVVPLLGVSTVQAASTPQFISKFGAQAKNNQFLSPYAVATDTSNNVYVVDAELCMIKKYSATGTFIAQWGQSGSGNGQFLAARGIATDSLNNVYVTDVSLNRIQKFTSAGAYVSQWGTAGTGDGEFNNPQGIAIDATDNIYVTDGGNNRIQKFTSAGAYVSQWGTAGTGDGEFNNPQGIAINKSSGNVYVGDFYNHRVQRFDSVGSYLEQWPVNNPGWLAIGSGGNVYVTDSSNDLIHKFSASGGFYAAPPGAPYGGNGTTDGLFSAAEGIATDGNDNVYVIDRNNFRIQKFTSAAFSPIVYERQWGVYAYQDSDQVHNPYDMATDTSGNIYTLLERGSIVKKFTSTGVYIAEWTTGGGTAITIDNNNDVYISSNNNEIKKFTSTGVPITQWGTYGTANGEFDAPAGMATDSANNIYVIDTNNNRIQKFTSTGVYMLQWGSGGNADGEFDFDYYNSVDIDSLGNVYVLDINNNRIQKFTSTGVFIAKWGTAGSGNGQFGYPTSLAVDSDNNVYVTDSADARIQKFDSSGTYIDQWGTAGSGNGQFLLNEEEETFWMGITISSSDKIYVSDGFANTIQIFGYQASSNDSDNDGVIDSVEAATPLGMDVNNDSVNDSQQSIVTTSFNAVAGAYTTAVIDNCSNGFTMFTNGPESSLAKQDSGYTYPLGLQSFTADCGVIGATAHIVQYFDKVYDTSAWVYRKYLPTIGYVDFSSKVTIGTAVVNGINVTKVSFSITDGSLYDTDGVANGRIADPVGPAIIGTLAETGTSLIVQELIAAVLLCGAIVIAPRRHKNKTITQDVQIVSPTNKL